MKAWILEDSTNYDKGQKLVFADTISGAKKQANDEPQKMWNHSSLDVDSWIDIRATRFKEMDDKEDLQKDEYKMMRLLMTEHGWWFSYGDEKWNKENISDFDAFYIDKEREQMIE